MAIVQHVEDKDFLGALDALEMRKNTLMTSFRSVMNQDSLINMDGEDYQFGENAACEECENATSVEDKCLCPDDDDNGDD